MPGRRLQGIPAVCQDNSDEYNAVGGRENALGLVYGTKQQAQDILGQLGPATTQQL